MKLAQSRFFSKHGGLCDVLNGLDSRKFFEIFMSSTNTRMYVHSRTESKLFFNIKVLEAVFTT